MERIKLISMPVVQVHRPSVGLTQLATVARQRFGDRVSVDVLYLAHDFACFMKEGLPAGVDPYALLVAYEHCGLGEWFFRQEAFPGLPDNTVEYFRRYFPGKSADAWKEPLLAKRRQLSRFFDDVVERHQLDTATIVGLSTMFSQNVPSFALARRVKERNPEVTTILGGPNCESPMGERLARNVEALDYVFSGPGLVSFCEFLEKREAGRHDELPAIKGVFTRTSSDRPAAERVGEELDIDAAVDLDYDSFFESFEKHFPQPERGPIVMFETARGCWWGARSHCTFCGLNGQGLDFRAMSPEKAIPYLQALIDRYRHKSDYFMAVDNIMALDYLSKVLPAIKTPPDTKIFYETKANLKDEHLRVMAAAGVNRLHAGIESMATSTLKLMAKGTTAFVNLRVLMDSLKYGVWCRWNLLVGLPGEEEDVYRKYVEDFPRLFHLAPPCGVAPIRFDRFSPYFMHPEKWGLELKRFDYYDLIYPYDGETLDDIAYYFMDANFGAEYMKVAARWIGRLGAVVERWRSRWNVRDGGRPARLELRRGPVTSVIVDTRGDGVSEHEVDGPCLCLLDHLEKPRLEKDIVQLGESEGFDALDKLQWLDRRGFIWTEDGRAMSIVTEGERSPRSPAEARAMAHGRMF